MKKNKLAHWLPRIVGLGFVIFISIFAFDVFDGAQSWWQAVVALLMHLIPSFLILAVVAAAWKRDLIGAVGFLLLAASYVVLVGIHRPWFWYALVAGPALLLALLYFISWRAGIYAAKSGLIEEEISNNL